MVYSVNGHYPIAVGMVGITLANLLSQRLDRNRSRYLCETLALWGLYGVSWSMTDGEVTGNLVTWVLLRTSLASIGGWRLMSPPSGIANRSLLVQPTADKTLREPADDSGTTQCSRTYRKRIAPSYVLRLGQA